MKNNEITELLKQYNLAATSLRDLLKSPISGEFRSMLEGSQKLSTAISTMQKSSNFSELHKQMSSINELTLRMKDFDAIIKSNISPIMDAVHSVKKVLSVFNSINFIMDNSRWITLNNAELSRIRADIVSPQNTTNEEWVDRTGVIISAPVKQALISTKFLPWDLLAEVLKNPERMRHITPRQFEQLIAELLDKLGYQDVQLTPCTRDGGRDIICVLKTKGIYLPVAIERKLYREDRKVDVIEMRAFFGAIKSKKAGTALGVIATTSTFTRDAIRFVADEVNINLKNFQDIVEDWVRPVRGQL